VDGLDRVEEHESVGGSTSCKLLCDLVIEMKSKQSKCATQKMK
jgi:hypothetical protein